MGCRSLVYGCTVVGLALGVLSMDPPSASATETVLASASFEDDALGSVAHPDGPPAVAEDVWDASTYSGGVSAVVTAGTTKRYRISDVGSSGETKGIYLPFSNDVLTGTLTVEAVATAEQTTSDGGFLSVNRPDEEEWACILGFGSDGKFKVHDSGTSTAYSANARYRFKITIHFGISPTADYLISDFASGNPILESNDHELPVAIAAGSMTFRTDAADDGAFTVDELSAVQ